MEVDITRKEAQYVTFVYRQQIEEGRRITTTTLAKAFQVSPATVTESFQKLAEKNILEYTPYYGVKLTDAGIAKAEKILRKHRLLETLFVRLMNFSPKTACNEASIIDYYCSEVLINHICSTYNHPLKCPCNKQIFKDPACLNEASNDDEVVRGI